MKAKLLSLAVISAFALSACGGDNNKPEVDNKTNQQQGQGQGKGQNQAGGSTVGATGGSTTGGSTTGGSTTGGSTTGGSTTGGSTTGGSTTGGSTTGGSTTGGSTTGGSTTGGSTTGGSTTGGSTTVGATGGSTTGGSTTGGSTTGGSTTGGSTTGGSTTGGSTTGGSTTGGSTTGGSTTGGATGAGATTTETPYDMEQQVTTFKIKSTVDESSGFPVTANINQTPTYSMGENDSEDKYKTLVINGKRVALVHFGGYRTATNFGTDYMGKINYDIADTLDPQRGTAYANYGIYWVYQNYDPNADDEEEIKLFYQGIPTPISDMPKTGTATYQGYAIARDFAQMEQGLNTAPEYSSQKGKYIGLSTFNVDFPNKTLKGTLNDWQDAYEQPTTTKQSVSIDAKIQANTFKGTANNVTVEGKFYGPKAQNLAGAFNDKDQNLQGVFGANKQ